jgi:hypothetical protein
MIGLVLLATAAATSTPATAIDAEIAFARDAQKIGQWSAFRKYADRDAVMFTPQAVWARDFLMDRKNPRKAIDWRPAHSFVSCDGRTAVNTGPWYTPQGRLAGYFTTVWQRTGKGWRWVYDGGIPTPAKKPVGKTADVQRASCAKRAPGAPIPPPPPLTAKQARITPEDNGRGESADKTLGWDWKVAKNGARTLRVYLWTRGRYVDVINAVDPAP